MISLKKNKDKVGTLRALPHKTIPLTYLPCNGQYVSPSQFPKLFSEIGYLFGETVVGNENYFRIPNINGRIVNENIIRLPRFLKPWDENAVEDSESPFEYKSQKMKQHIHNTTISNEGVHEHDITLVDVLLKARNRNYRDDVDGIIDTGMEDVIQQVPHTLFHGHSAGETKQTFGADISHIAPVRSSVIIAVYVGE